MVNLMDFSRCKAIGRTVWFLLHVAQAADRFDTADAPAAAAIQIIKALRQFALDSNEWRLPWPLVCLRDPYQKLEFERDEEELEIMADHVEAREKLGTEMKSGEQGGPRGPRCEAKAQEDNA